MIYGISGKSKSGKNEVASIIQYLDFLNSNDMIIKYEDWKISREAPLYQGYEIKSFADKLKDMVVILTGCKREDLEDQEFKASKLSKAWNDSHGIDTYRQLLQVLGTDCGRNIIHPTIWSTALFADYKALNPPRNMAEYHLVKRLYPDWIIADVRFPDEVEKVKERLGMVIRIERPGIDTNDQHASETALDDYDFENVIINDGSIDDLGRKIEALIHK